MSEIQKAISKGFKTVSDYNDYKFEKNFTEFKQHIKNNHDTWEDISEDDIKRLFIFEMFDQLGMPKELTVSDYLDDNGVAPLVNYFSNSELELLKTVEALSEEEFNFQRNLGVDTMMKLLKEVA